MKQLVQPAFDAPASDWSVYSDWLQDAADPRGELIALAVAGDLAARDAHVLKHWATLVGDVSPEDVELDWHYAVLRGVTVKQRTKTGELMTKVLGLPIASQLRRVELRGYGPVDLNAAMDVLARNAPATCTDFAFVDHRATEAKMLVSRDFEPPANLVTFGSLQKFWGRAEAISIDCADAGQVTLGSIDAPELRSFALRCLRFCDWEDLGGSASKFEGAAWPKLESFELRCVETWVANVPSETDPYVAIYSADDYEGRDDTDDGDSEGVNWDELADLFTNLATCPLRRLALTSFVSVRSMLDALEEAGLAPTLRELDFSDSMFADDDAAWMVERNRLFKTLDKIIVNNTPLGTDGLRALKSIGPAVVHSEGTGATYRYVVGQE